MSPKKLCKWQNDHSCRNLQVTWVGSEVLHASFQIQQFNLRSSLTKYQYSVWYYINQLLPRSTPVLGWSNHVLPSPWVVERQDKARWDGRTGRRHCTEWATHGLSMEFEKAASLRNTYGVYILSSLSRIGTLIDRLASINMCLPFQMHVNKHNKETLS